jgi:hypothetical protein
LDNEVKKKWEKALKEHEGGHPQPIIRNLNGNPVGENYKPKTQSMSEEEGAEERGSA